jgi:hypothetical protein
MSEPSGDRTPPNDPRVEEAVRERLDSDRRWQLIRSSYGAISDEGHPWDHDLARWVQESRRADERRLGRSGSRSAGRADH